MNKVQSGFPRGLVVMSSGGMSTQELQEKDPKTAAQREAYLGTIGSFEASSAGIVGMGHNRKSDKELRVTDSHDDPLSIIAGIRRTSVAAAKLQLFGSTAKIDEDPRPASIVEAEVAGPYDTSRRPNAQAAAFAIGLAELKAGPEA